MPMSVQYGAASPLLHCKYRGVYDALSENIVDSSDYSDLSNHCSLYTVQFVQQGAKIWNFTLILSIKMIKMRRKRSFSINLNSMRVLNRVWIFLRISIADFRQSITTKNLITDRFTSVFQTWSKEKYLMEIFHGRMNTEWKTIMGMDGVEEIRTELGRGWWKKGLNFDTISTLYANIESWYAWNGNVMGANLGWLFLITLGWNKGFTHDLPR